MNFKYFSGELSDKDLENEDRDPDYQEHRVMEQTLEYVELVVDLLRVQHVEDLHQHERREDHSKLPARAGVVVAVTVLLVEVAAVPVVEPARHDEVAVPRLVVGVFGDELLACEHDREDDDGLVERHEEDVLDHLARDDVLVSAVGRALEERRFGCFSRKRQRCQ